MFCTRYEVFIGVFSCANATVQTRNTAIEKRWRSIASKIVDFLARSHVMSYHSVILDRFGFYLSTYSSFYTALVVEFLELICSLKLIKRNKQRNLL